LPFSWMMPLTRQIVLFFHRFSVRSHARVPYLTDEQGNCSGGGSRYFQTRIGYLGSYSFLLDMSLLHLGNYHLNMIADDYQKSRSYTLLVKLCWQMPDLNKSSLYFPVWGLSWSVVGSLRKRFPLARENRCMIIPRNAQRDMHSAEMACEPAS